MISSGTSMDRKGRTWSPWWRRYRWRSGRCSAGPRTAPAGKRHEPDDLLRFVVNEALHPGPWGDYMYFEEELGLSYDEDE